MADTPEPVLVYTRIEANGRATRRLLWFFAVALLPIVSTATVFMFPWVAMLVGYIAYALWPEALIAHIQAADAALAATRAERSLTLGDLPRPYLYLLGGTLIASMIAVALGMVGMAAVLIYRYAARMILRRTSARAVTEAEEPDLFRVVENLCIAAGLPQPAIHVVESGAPNAFATGMDPTQASLVLTRGLLTLLDRRELEAVVAHELSHIGNNDIKLSTTLAALVNIATVPFRIFAAPFRVGPWFGWLAALFHFNVGLLFFYIAGLTLSDVITESSGVLAWWNVHAVLAPLYALFLSPVLALLIRQGVSWQREFLADADATLLTRDPEGLALALVKIGSAHGERLQVGESVVHLCFVDPVSVGTRSGAWWQRLDASLLHRIFPSHPPLAERIDLLARMGSGIGRQALEAALEAGTKAREAARALELRTQPVAVPAAAPAAPANVDPLPQETLTPLYERPDGWSRVLAQLSQDAQVTVVGTEGNFMRVRTRENLLGYVSRTAPLAALGPQL